VFVFEVFMKKEAILQLAANARTNSLCNPLIKHSEISASFNGKQDAVQFVNVRLRHDCPSCDAQ
jgi:hypothetical protein